VHSSGSGGVALRPTGHRGDPAVIEDGRIIVRMWAEMPEQLPDPAPVVRWTDRHGSLYYSYRQRTERFPADTDWIPAALKLEQWTRTGPQPDDPEPQG
jgi:hypothetical protein